MDSRHPISKCGSAAKTTNGLLMTDKLIPFRRREGNLIQEILNALAVPRLPVFFLLVGALFMGLFSVDACLGLSEGRLWPVIRALTAYIFYTIVLCQACRRPPPLRIKKVPFLMPSLLMQQHTAKVKRGRANHEPKRAVL
jgi:hypothetical protein